MSVNEVKTKFTADTSDLDKKTAAMRANLERDAANYSATQRKLEADLARVSVSLDKVVLSSNRLGDTSATVARRYEKLSEGIALQNARLNESAIAFAAGDINAKKYAATLASVETQTRSLTSRIADAKARATEIGETGFTHFQNQIAGGVAGNQGGISSLFRNLSSYQKTQLSFQANDIISGIAMGQSPTQILAQQGGQIVQIFQMGKQNAEGLATATAEYAASAKVAEAALTEGATEAKTISVAMNSASGATTILGTTLVSLGAVLAAGVAVIAGAWKFSSDMRAEAEKRLAAEIKITAEWNKQHQIAADSRTRPETEAASRAFDRFAGGDNMFGLTAAAQRINREREPLLSALNYGTATKTQIDELAKLDDQLSKISARADEIQSGYAGRAKTFLSGVADDAAKTQQNWDNAAKAADDAAKKRAEAEKKAAEERKKRQEEALKLQQDIKKATESLVDADFARAGKENPFVAFLGNANKEMRSLLETAKILSPALRSAFQQQLQQSNQDDLFGLRLSAKQEAFDLRLQRDRFSGYSKYALYPEDVKQAMIFQERLTDIANSNPTTERQRQLRDQSLISLAKTVDDPNKLNYVDRQRFASAFENEARRKIDSEQNANDYFTQMLGIISKSGLKVDLGNQAAISIDVNNGSNGTINATKRSSQSGAKRSTAGAMELPISLDTSWLNSGS